MYHTERLERGRVALLKLRQMRTQRVHMKRILPWLVHWARLTRDFCPALAALAGPIHTILHFISVSVSCTVQQAIVKCTNVPRHIYLFSDTNSLEKVFKGSG
jgi:hypothetical protein